MALKETKIPVSLMAKLLNYDPETGLFTWRERSASWFASSGKARPPEWEANRWNSRHAGKPAMTTTNSGYKIGRVDSVILMAHRVAWAIHYGSWPENDIDHIDGDRSNNRICNLRSATRSQNMMNIGVRSSSKSGLKGVSPIRGKWMATIGVNGKSEYLGVYECKFAAYEAYKKRAEELHGEFMKLDLNR